MLPTDQSAFWRSLRGPARLGEYWFFSEPEHDDRRFRKRWGLSDDALDRQFARKHCGLSDVRIRTALIFHEEGRRCTEKYGREHDPCRSAKDLCDIWFRALPKVTARLELLYGHPVDHLTDLVRDCLDDPDWFRANLAALPPEQWANEIHFAYRSFRYFAEVEALSHDEVPDQLCDGGLLEHYVGTPEEEQILRYEMTGATIRSLQTLYDSRWATSFGYLNLLRRVYAPVALSWGSRTPMVRAHAHRRFSMAVGDRAADGADADSEPLAHYSDTIHGRLALPHGWAVFSSKYSVGVTAVGGIPSASLIYSAAKRIKQSEGAVRPIILYIGDAGDAGMRIERHVLADLGLTHGVAVELRRVAISPEEAEERGSDEVEVIPIGELRSRLEVAIRGVLGDAPKRRAAALAEHHAVVERAFELARNDPHLSVLVDSAHHRLNDLIVQAKVEGGAS